MLGVGVMVGGGVSDGVGLGPGVGDSVRLGVSVGVDVGDGPRVGVRVGVPGVTVVAGGVSVTILDVIVGWGTGVGSCVKTPVGGGANVAVRATVGSGVTEAVPCAGPATPARAGITWPTSKPMPKRHRRIIAMKARRSLIM
jgi:hypothetical protein